MMLTIATHEGDLRKAEVWEYCHERKWLPLHPVPQLQVALEMGNVRLLKAIDGELAFPLIKQQQVEAPPTKGPTAAEQRAKRYFSADEIKGGGMVWRTIRGNKVLIKPTGDGGGVVVGGASGKLNHFRIDLSTTKETYEQRREEKRGKADADEKEKLAGMTLAEQKTYQQEKRQGVKIRKEAGLITKRRYETYLATMIKENRLDNAAVDKVKEAAVANAQAQIQNLAAAMGGGKELVAIDPNSIKWGEGGVRFEQMPEGRAGTGGFKVPATDMEEIKEAAIKAAVHEHLKDIEREAVEALARRVSGEELALGDKITAEQLDEDTKGAMEVMKAKQKMKRELKKIESDKDVAVYITKVNVNKQLTKAELDEVADATIEKSIKDMVETQKNIELYDRMDGAKLSAQKFVDEGAADSFNGLVGDLFGAGTVFDADLVRNIGVEGLARIVAAKVANEGKRDQVLKALTDFAEKKRLQIVDGALKESDRRRGFKKDLMKAVGGVNDAAAMETWSNAMRFCQRQNAQEERVLGSAIGSLRAVAHVINALEEPSRQVIQFPAGETIDAAKEKMRRAGLKTSEGDYSVDLVGGKAMVTLASRKIDKIIDSSKQAISHNQLVEDIKAGKKNTGYKPPGIAQSFIDKRTGATTALKLKGAQESAVRLFRETGKVLMDQEAGLGKTGIIYSCAMEAYHNMGSKKVLIVVPANLREQMHKDSKMWLDPSMHGLVHPYQDKGGLPGRIAQYEKEGVHIIGHEQLRTDADALKAAGFQTIFVDEAHRLTSPEGAAEDMSSASQQYEGLMKLRNAKHKVLLSGTNIKNDVSEIYKKINWLDADHKLGSQEDFHKRYGDLNQGTGIFQSAAVEAFRKDISPYTFTQKNPLKVKNNEHSLKTELSPRQRQELQRINESYRNDPDVAGRASRRDAAIYKTLYDGPPDNPRIQTMISTLESNHPGEKALIHMRQKDSLRSVAAALEQKYGKGCYRVIIGGGGAGEDEISDPVMKQKAEQAKKDFNSDPKVRFLLGTSAMSTGHDGLQNVAKVQVNYDRAYTYAEQGQRNARLYRTGQDKDVDTYYTTSAHPYDINAEDIVETKKRKHEMMGNPRDVEGWDESGFATQLERHGFFENTQARAE